MDPNEEENRDREIMSGRDQAADADAAEEVDCELTLQLPYYSSPPPIVDDGSRPPSTTFLPPPYASVVLPPPPHIPEQDSNHSRRLSLHVHRDGGRGGVGGASAPAPRHYNIVRPLTRRPTHTTGNDENDTIPPPFPWATDRRATVRSLKCLTAAGITEITGESQCRHCELRVTIKLDLHSNFADVVAFMYERLDLMRDRAPEKWLTPKFPGCASCGQVDCVRPVMAENKRNINWLFLFLGQWLGVCTLEQLKYFCKHTQNHRTGAKDRVLYLSYCTLCMQLDPMLPFVQRS